MKVNLYNLKEDNIRVTVDAYFNDGALVVEGYDIGSKVKELLGDSDYEYFVTVTKEEVGKVYSSLNIEGGNKIKLLEEIQKSFKGNSAYRDYRDWLESENITGEGFYYV